ncbi:DNA translocase FtsK [Derxia gummosa]|uniref:DNA translocase FtsK n=1 Tax=Derxia gummosa DSM 723 TaxID=1121388 RepID=A0A9U5CVR2_9BURK|nr:DNA translocase FtsK [Derxia gummosa]
MAGDAEPAHLLELVAEARWIVFAVLAIYLLTILVTFHPGDPGWSQDTGNPVLNKGGRFGAWLADLLLYLFGVSVAWWGFLCGRHVLLGLMRLRARLSGEAVPPVADRRQLAVSAGAFLLLLGASAGYEALRWRDAGWHLPYTGAGPSGAGGLLGGAIASHAQTWFGDFGAYLALLTAFFIGFSFYFHVSWLEVSERIGLAVEHGIERARAWIETRRDRRAGEVAAQEREAMVAVERAHFEVAKETRPPVIETPRLEPSVGDLDIDPELSDPLPFEPSVPGAPVGVAPKSERVAREAQKPLFAELSDSSLPTVDLLDPPSPTQEFVSTDTLEFTSRLIEKKLKDFGVEATVVAAFPGPVITRYEIEPATGVKGAQIVNLAKDLARALTLTSIRVVETIPGKNTMGLELPNPKRQTVRLSEILGSTIYDDAPSRLTMALGKDIAGKPVVADLAKMPHLLVAGTTGSGKSVGINAMILSLVYKATPDQVRLILIDPKMLEMSVYEGIPHLLAPVVTDMKQAGHALNWCVAEMERRYKLMSKIGVRNLAGYNNKIDEAAKKEEKIPNPLSLTPDAPEPLDKLPTIVIVIDELADLMMVVGKKVEELIARIAQKARAAGIHLILATQRPSVDVITGLIKANVPTRISFQVSSKIDSRTILDQQGAEALLGMGDMLYMASGTGLPMRVHGAFVSDDEVHRVVEQLKKAGPPDYVDGILEGGVESDYAVDLGAGSGVGSGAEGGEDVALYDQAVAVVLKNRKASISLVQRNLRIGYNRAARLLEQMEQSGLVSAMQTNGNREILVPISGNE